MAVHHPSTDELQEDIQRILELIVHPRLLQRTVHRTRQWRVRVRIQKESE